MDNALKLITNEEELNTAQAELGRLLEIDDRSEDDDRRLGVLAVIIRSYEDEHWALDMPDPILAIQSRMDDLGLDRSDLLDVFGNKTTASQVLTRTRALTLPMIRTLSRRLSLPIAVLAQEYKLHTSRKAQPRQKLVTELRSAAPYRRRA